MSSNEKPPIHASGSHGAGTKNGPDPGWENGLQAELDERVQRAFKSAEVRLQRELSGLEEKQRRVHERLEKQFSRFQTPSAPEPPSLIRNGRERVLKAARALFLSNGYASTSMQEIAEAAGLRKASIYHHFKDKEALFSEIVITELEASWSRYAKTVEDDRPLAGILFEIATEQLALSGTDVGRLYMDFQKFVPEARHADMHAKLSEMVDANAQLFRRAIERQEINPIDPRVAALFFFHMASAWTFHGMTDPSILPATPQIGARTIVDVLMNGLTGGLGALADQTGANR